MSVEDTSKSSFLFSLTDKERFILKDTSEAIQRNKNKEKIQFGRGVDCFVVSGYFEIGDKAHCRSWFHHPKNNVVYYCPSYARGDQTKFTGSKER